MGAMGDKDAVAAEITLFKRDWLRDVVALRQAEARSAALEAALRALVATEPRYLQHISADDMYADACAYCTGIMDEGNRVFLHEPDCAWLAARALVGIA